MPLPRTILSMLGWHFPRTGLVLGGTLVAMLLSFPVRAAAAHDDKSSDRPKLPYGMMGLRHEDVDAYDSKAEPVAEANAALSALNNAGWGLIHKYFPNLGVESTGEEQRVHPDDRTDNRFFAHYATEDSAYSPMPLLCMIWSLPDSALSGRLKALHDQLAPAMTVEDYSAWKLGDLRKAVSDMTTPAKTAQGTKYRTAKTNLSFAQALRLYAMTLALLRAETKWADKADTPAPDMADFTNRLRQQLPQQLREAEPAAMFLYRPGVFNHPLSKDEFEERADAVTMTRIGSTVEVQQFPVYLTEDQKEWSPAWIRPVDEANDTTLIARKFDHDWTRLDGPYLWVRGDQLNGPVTYRATVKPQPDTIVIEAERMIESRGAVKRVPRPRDYNAALMTAFRPGVDSPAGLPDAFTVDPPGVEVQAGNLKRLGPYFSNSFRAWCEYGLSESGLAPDGKTWVSVAPDPPRPGAPKAVQQGNLPAVAATQTATTNH
jgi:hypothetical protein